ncbi:kinase-like domain-containing protein [Obelidium mucronatum]|nr:kinase-like domain-containing protein [Obelidium mucronatum]
MALVIKVEKPVFETVAETAAKPQLLPNVTAEEAYKQLSSVGLANVERLLDTKIKRADEELILKYFASRAQLIRCVDDAVSLMEEVHRIPHSQTRNLLRENDLEINGVFSSGNPSRATLLTAFKSGRPMLLKISSQPEQEILIWESLFPNPYQENSFHLVGPLELVNFSSSGGELVPFSLQTQLTHALRSGILMPIYLAALEQVPKPMKEALALKVYKDMLIALNHIHQLGFCHADIKPANIFIDADGRYFLGDFGACVRIGANLFEGSVNYVPKKVGFPQVGSAGLDHLLLVVTVLEKLARLDVGNGFEVEELISCIEKIRDTALVDCLRVSLDFASEVLNQ